MIAAIILAAGESRRMGEPKALLRLGGMTFLGRILSTARDAGIEQHVVVLGIDSDKLLLLKELESVTVTSTAEPEAGPIGSIRAGVRAVINRTVDAVVVWHVDQPHVAAGTIRALVEAFRRSEAQIVLPVHAGRRGHPVLFGRAVFGELLEASASEGGARSVVRRDPSRVAEIAVSDRAVLEDIDTPEAYQNLIARH